MKGEGNMKTLVQVFKLAVLTTMLVSAAACSKKDDKANITRTRAGYGGGYNNTYPGNFNPGTGGNYGNSDCPNCGTIYGSNLSQSVQMFVDTPGAVGMVNGNQGSSTGVVFMGNVDARAQGGYVNIIIWDDIAAQYGEPYVVQMELDAYNSELTSSYGRLVFNDAYGSVTFQGNFSQNSFMGTVSFQNSTGQSGTLGNFQTGSCNFVECY